MATSLFLTLALLGPPSAQAGDAAEGSVLLSCIVQVNGTVKDCKVEEESPKDAGFGEAALKLTPQFRMKPQIVGGKPVGGARVRIPMVFKPETKAPAP